MTEQTDAEKIAALEARVAELESKNDNLEKATKTACHNAPGAIFSACMYLELLSKTLEKKEIFPQVEKSLKEISFYLALTETELSLARLQLVQDRPEVIDTEIKPHVHTLVYGFQMRRNKKHNIQDSRHMDIALKIAANVPKELKVARGVVLSAVSNFLSNAVKFSLAKTQIDVEVEFNSNANKGELFVSVRDQAMGMTADEIARVFQAGATVGLDNPDVKKLKGHGEGLGTVAALVDKAGGTCGAESDGPGKGSKFWIRVPAQPAP